MVFSLLGKKFHRSSQSWNKGRGKFIRARLSIIDRLESKRILFPFIYTIFPTRLNHAIETRAIFRQINPDTIDLHDRFSHEDPIYSYDYFDREKRDDILFRILHRFSNERVSPSTLGPRNFYDSIHGYSCCNRNGPPIYLQGSIRTSVI